MKLATQKLIKEIDNYAESVLNISTRTLMGRAGSAVASSARGMVSPGAKILILAGKGNNGGDGYAAAAELCADYSVTVCDLFRAGQRSEAGKHYLALAQARGVDVFSGDSQRLGELVGSSDLIIDAIFGTGFSGEVSGELRELAALVNASAAQVLAVDIPLGVCSDTAEVDPHGVRADLTVALTLRKPCHISYPAREYVGAVVLDTLGLDAYLDNPSFIFNNLAMDEALAADCLPKRHNTSNKGSFGKTLHLTGSDKYRGAAHLALEASLRSGVGIVAHFGTPELNAELRMKYPEAIYHDGALVVGEVLPLAEKYSSILVGSGSSVTEELYRVTAELIATEGCPLVLDADALNSISRFGKAEVLKGAKRKIILTPHPLELSRLTGLSTDYIATHRISVATDFAREYGVILLLKGAATVITDGTHTYLNTTGSTALSKGGSGDVLAGLVASLCAYSHSLTRVVALAAYIHGRAGDTLSAELSDFGVTPSDLPTEIARHIRLLQNEKLDKTPKQT